MQTHIEPRGISPPGWTSAQVVLGVNGLQPKSGVRGEYRCLGAARN